MAVAAAAIILLTLGQIALAGMVVWLSREYRRTVDEVTELQAALDLVFLSHGEPPHFAGRYGMEVVIDPSKLPPPEAPDAE